jgi:hypothetical protein
MSSPGFERVPRMTMPVLSISEALSTRDGPAKSKAKAVLNVRSLVVQHCSRFVAGKQPEQLLALFIPFLTS